MIRVFVVMFNWCFNYTDLEYVIIVDWGFNKGFNKGFAKVVDECGFFIWLVEGEGYVIRFYSLSESSLNYFELNNAYLMASTILAPKLLQSYDVSCLV